jgi:8-oxo-dGTP pyrophosphatase MutT (NUDIX family)
MHRILFRLWRLIRGPLQWRVLYVFHARFIIGVTGVCRNSAGHVLVLQHRYWPPDSWGLPSGYIKRGESFDAALIREVREETGYVIDNVRVLQARAGFRLRVEVYLVADVVSGVEKLDSNEVVAARFCDPKSLPLGMLESHQSLVAIASSDAVPTQERTHE